MLRTNLVAVFSRQLVVAAVAILFAPHVWAAEANFSGKVITLIVTSNVGGGTDSMARLVGRYLHEYLPGKPAVISVWLPRLLHKD